VGRVEYTPLTTGASTASDVNAVFSAIQTQSSTIDAENYAEEGFDERVFETEVQAASGFAPITETTRGRTQALTTSWATVDPGGATTFQTGGITVGTNERLYAVIYIELFSDSKQEGIPTNGDIQTRWRQSVGASPSVVGTTRRWYADSTNTALKSSGAPAMWSHQIVLDGPLTLDWVEVQISDQSGNDVTVQYGDVAMHGMIFKRVT
jgi:hypothetical protein